MPSPGFLYVAHLSTGDVKLGRAADPEKRLQQHATNAAMFRAHLVETWVSALVEDAADTELELIHRAEILGARRLADTREVFEGMAFAEVRALAEEVACEALEREAVDASAAA